MSFAVLAMDLSIGFIALFILVKILGKTQLSQLSPFDFISAIVLGELLAEWLEKDGIYIVPHYEFTYKPSLL